DLAFAGAAPVSPRVRCEPDAVRDPAADPGGGEQDRAVAQLAVAELEPLPAGGDFDPRHGVAGDRLDPVGGAPVERQVAQVVEVQVLRDLRRAAHDDAAAFGE